MATPPPPPNFDPSGFIGPSPSQAALGGLNLPLITLVGHGLDAFIRKATHFETEWLRESREVIQSIVEQLAQEAQYRSPYLYGILQGAHLADSFIEGDSPTGVVHIDPDVTHPILGGRPVDYGARIHGEDRPWFGWTVEETADDIIRDHEAELTNVYAELFSGGASEGMF